MIFRNQMKKTNQGPCCLQKKFHKRLGFENRTSQHSIERSTFNTGERERELT